MTESLETLRSYVHFLHEQDGVRQIRLSPTAQRGLARLVAKIKDGEGGPLPSSKSEVRDKTQVPAGSGLDKSLARPATRAGNGTLSPPAPSEKIISAANEPAFEISGSSKEEQLRHLAERASVCVKCPHLAARRHTVVFGVGNPDARLMFIGEGPGEEEDLQGEPFVGRAGQLLTKMILAMGLTREQVYIANIVKCRPDMPAGAPGNRKPTKQEMDTCVPYLRAQIEVIRPALLVALGATAVEGLLGPVGTIGSLRGKFLEYRGTPLMPTYHPSYLLRNPSNTEKRKVWEDLLQAMGRLDMPISEKQRGFFLAK
jgi:uracil-DNA glycosylase family 4